MSISILLVVTIGEVIAVAVDEDLSLVSIHFLLVIHNWLLHLDGTLFGMLGQKLWMRHTVLHGHEVLRWQPDASSEDVFNT